MPVCEIHAKSLLRIFNRTDSWFLARYSMNLYRGCAHNCIYCDGRSEKYNVAGNFGTDIVVKANAAQLLDKELDPSRRRKPLRRGFIVLGGGVCDSYQPVDTQYKLTRDLLTIIKNTSSLYIFLQNQLWLKEILTL